MKPNKEVGALRGAAQDAMRWAQADMPSTGYKAIERHRLISDILDATYKLATMQSLDDIWRAAGQPDRSHIDDATQAREDVYDGGTLNPRPEIGVDYDYNVISNEVGALLGAAQDAMRWAQADMPATGYKAIERHRLISDILNATYKLATMQALDDIWRAAGQPDRVHINDAKQARLDVEARNP